MREDIHKQFIDDVRADIAGGKKPVAEQMTDAVVGTGGGGGPRGPPPAPGTAGYVRSAVDDIGQKRQPQVFSMNSPRGKRGGPKPGPYTKGKGGKKIDEPDANTPGPAPPSPPPAPPPAGGSVGQKISKIQKPIYDKKGKAKGRGASKKKKDELNGLPNPAAEPAPIPPPALPPPNNSPGLKLRLIGKQKPLPHTTIADKRNAAADALAATRAAADASALLLPDDANVSKKRKASEKRKPQPGDPPAPTLEPAPAIVKITKPKSNGKSEAASDTSTRTHTSKSNSKSAAVRSSSKDNTSKSNRRREATNPSSTRSSNHIIKKRSRTR
jgi:hypothetical protein